MKTKKLLFKTAASLRLPVAFLLLCGLTSPLSAQVIVPATNADNVIGNFGNPNTATIDYTPNCTGLPCMGTPNLQLTAIVESESLLNPGTNPILWLNDQFSGWVPTVLPMPPDFQPDVIIGNDVTTSNQYIVGIVGVKANDVFLLTYSVSGEGTGTLTITPTGTYNISGSGNVVGSPAHIDIEAQYSTPFLGGQPTCNNFAITWEDMTIGIMGYFASLSAPTSGTPTTIKPLAGMVLQPDVALVERLNPHTNMFEDWALFGYMQAGPPPQKLVYQEWNTASTPSASVVYDNTHTYLPYGYVASAVRIDAIDDYTLNMPGPGVYPGTPPAPFAYFDMVIAAAIPGPMPRAKVLEFNNKLGAGVSTDITTPVAALANNFNHVPVVTCGPGRFYSVGYVSSQGTATASLGNYSTPIDWSTGTTTTSNNAYSINLNPWGPSPTPTPGAVALGATCNTELIGQQQLYAAWENNGSMFEKVTATVPYGFKHTPSQTATVVNSDEWQLSPNPATDIAVLSAPTGFSTADGGRYRITDLSGKEMLHGAITENEQQISVNTLPAGMYLLTVHSAETEKKVIKFVKE